MVLHNSASGSIPNPYTTPYGNALGTTGDLPWTTGLWWKYMGNHGSYLCPVDTKQITST